jgi:hypothetical protein
MLALYEVVNLAVERAVLHRHQTGSNDRTPERLQVLAVGNVQKLQQTNVFHPPAGLPEQNGNSLNRFLRGKPKVHRNLAVESATHCIRSCGSEERASLLVVCPV